MDKSEKVRILYCDAPEFGSFPVKHILGFGNGSQVEVGG